jgi:hypothetical protein
MSNARFDGLVNGLDEIGVPLQVVTPGSQAVKFMLTEMKDGLDP